MCGPRFPRLQSTHFLLCVRRGNSIEIEALMEEVITNLSFHIVIIISHHHRHK